MAALSAAISEYWEGYMAYHRIMLKLSGEALGVNGWLFDHEKIMAVAKVIKCVADGGTQVGIVIGGGNLWRGRSGAAQGMDAVRADQMGMLGTVMNCIVMQDGNIGEGAEMDHCILDKQVTVREGARLIGPETYPIVLAKNLTV